MSYIHLWYVKEYRFDRMRIHLATSQGRRLLFLPFRRPPLTPKALFIGGAGLCICVWAFVAIPLAALIKFLLMDILLFPLTALLVLILKIPTQLYHSFIISRAVSKIRAHTRMTVIGITGSYGKTSTKEMLYTIVSSAYKTIKTEASKNSPIAISELLLSKLKPEHEVFIVEMGAYKVGEIAAMCEIVRPDIGIVTAINAQHQDLFGSIQHTMDAKYELIAGLRGKNIAIINNDNEYTRKMADRASSDGKQVLRYTRIQGSVDHPGVLRARNVVATATALSFDVYYGTKHGSISVPLLGEHHVSNILAAVGGALNVGMSFEDVITASKEIKPFDKTMQQVAGIRGSIFIDDTFNNNPDAASAAIDFFSLAKGRKILVFQPMIELGAYASQSHVMVGTYAGEMCDDIILTNDNFYEDILSGARAAHASEKVSVKSAENAAAYIRKVVKANDMVIFKGKESARVLHILHDKNV